MTAPPRTDAARLRRLFQQLLDEYSPSGKEHDVVEVAEAALCEAGLPVTRLPVADERDNLLVLPEGEEAELVLVGHLDTVPAYDIDDFAYNAEGDIVYGLGAADMKGGCAALMEAFIAWQAADAGPRPAALALVVGEEETGDGADALLDEHHFRWALIGEPTDLVPCLEGWSYLEVTLEARGRRAHAALGDPAKNAIQILLHRLLRVTAFLDGHPARPAYNLRDLNSAAGGFAVPAYCEAAIDVHLPPAAPLGDFVTGLEEHLLADLGDEARRRTAVAFETIDAGFQLPDRGLLPEALQRTYAGLDRPWAPGAFRSHSDANRFFAAGVRPLVLGPGTLAVAHTADEQVAFSQVEAAAEIYLGLLSDLARRP